MESITAVDIPEETVPHPISDDTGLKQIDSWRDFTKKTTFHGVRYIFEKSGLRFRRRIWLVVVVAAIFVFVIQVGIRTGNYLEYKTTIDVGEFYKDHLEFPAITICNQNRHRTTAVVEHGLYDVVDEVFKRSNVSEIPWEKFGDRVNGIDYGEFTLRTGHQKHVFIESCTWNGVDCDIDKDFKAVLTDLGLCYTFNGQENLSRVYTPKAGAGSGLKLVINVEQYEYMRGPQDDAGIKILLHPPGETPIMQKQGFAAAPGTHTLVAMKRYEVTTLQPPYGICHPNNSPISQCHAQCQTRDIINACRCRAEYMQPIINNATEMMKSEWECACKPPCKQVRYEPLLSYAQLSKFNIDRMILDNPDKRKRIEEPYLKARETTQHYREEIRSKDTADMTRLATIANRLQRKLQDIREKTTDPLTTSGYYNLPAIIIRQHFHMDFESIMDKINKLKSSIYRFLAYFIRYMLLDIKHMEDTFLEWDGSVFKFHQFLSVCLEEATAAQQNNSSDGSGDVDLGLSNNSLIYVPPKCKVQIQNKADLVDYVFQSPDFQQAESIYQNIVASIFQNSTKSSDAVDDHKVCLYVLGLEVQEAFPELLNELQNFIKAETLEDYMSVTNKMIITVKVLIGARSNITRCRWVGSTLADIETQLDRYHAYLSNGILMAYFDTMSKTVDLMAEDVEVKVQPIFEMITAYMNESVTKMELARHMISPLTTKAIEELAEFGSNAYIVIKSLQEKLTNFKNRLISIYVTIAESPLPIMKIDDFKNLEFFKLAYDTNRTEFQHLIYGLSENMTNVQQLLDLVFSEYQLSFQECLGAMPGAFREISDHLAMLRDDLQVYAESTSLNVNFFMENFLQLEIFYKDMLYEVIAQQEAFGLLSLLGEVGGFLGLLLGASVITVCELLDYLLLNVVRNCAGRCKEDPKVVKMESG